MKTFYSFIVATFIVSSLFAATDSETMVRQAQTLLILGKEPVDFFVETMGTRNTEMMFSLAKDVKASDLETAEKMLDCCAMFAALQQKKELFLEICGVHPQGEKYKSLLLGSKQPSMLPQIVKVKKLEEINSLSSDYLASWESFFANAFEKITEKEFASIADLVNDGRWNLDAEKMMEASEKIAKLKMKKNMPRQLSAVAVLKEAMLFAEISKNTKAFSKCIEIGKSYNLLQKKELKEAELTLKSFGQTRGSKVWVNTTRDVWGRSVYRNGVRHTRLNIGNDTQVDIMNDSSENLLEELFLLPFKLLATFLKSLSRALK